MRAVDFLLDAVVPGRAARAAGAFFFELRVRGAADFFLLELFLLEALEVDFFRVTLVFASFR